MRSGSPALLAMPKKERGLIELYHEDPERADWLVFGRKAGPDRRGFLRGAGLASMGAVLGTTIPFSANMPLGLIPAALAETVDEFTHRIQARRHDRAQRPAGEHRDAAASAGRRHHPTDVHFIRNNGTMPMPMSKAEWRLKIDGEVEEELELSYDQLMNEFEQVTLRLQLECGGNGRAGFNPLPRGNPWTIGAIGCSEWTGVRLRDVLRRAGLKQSAVYTGHFSYDEHLSGDPDRQAISRGGPIDKMMDPHT
jgi:DMSO/TMAO reductase YedYZ molybdopterin-dependent catalytic subunit